MDINQRGNDLVISGIDGDDLHGTLRGKKWTAAGAAEMSTQLSGTVSKGVITGTYSRDNEKGTFTLSRPGPPVDVKGVWVWNIQDTFTPDQMPYSWLEISQINQVGNRVVIAWAGSPEDRLNIGWRGRVAGNTVLFGNLGCSFGGIVKGNQLTGFYQFLGYVFAGGGGYGDHGWEDAGGDLEWKQAAASFRNNRVNPESHPAIAPPRIHPGCFPAKKAAFLQEDEDDFSFDWWGTVTGTRVSGYPANASGKWKITHMDVYPQTSASAMQTIDITQRQNDIFFFFTDDEYGDAFLNGITYGDSFVVTGDNGYASFRMDGTFWGKKIHGTYWFESEFDWAWGTYSGVR